MPTTIAARNIFQFVEDAFKDYERGKDGKDKPFDLLVCVAGRNNSPGPRDERWEFMLDWGKDKIEKVLKREGIGSGPHYFIFPDRWMVPGESMEFVPHLWKNPDAKKFDRVYIVTHQPYIVGNCFNWQCRILTKKE
jgi:hypothetical protein